MKNLKKLILLPFSIAALISLSACAPNLSPNSYSGSSVGVAKRTIAATVISMRKVKIDNKSGVGGLAGAGAGAIAGSAIGGNSKVGALGAIGGAIAGGLIGSEIDKSIHSGYGYEYILKTINGKLLSVTQSKNLRLRRGQRVYVIYGRMTRIIPR